MSKLRDLLRRIRALSAFGTDALETVMAIGQTRHARRVEWFELKVVESQKLS